MRGLIFDIREFALHDGAGIRTTVFLKGCPMRCVWCHNPEGLSPRREVFLKQKGCTHCGLCLRPCGHPDCRGLGRCLHVCPQNLVRAAGEEWESKALARKLLSQSDVYAKTGGGITLSGGEPLLQAEFCAELLGGLRGKVHCAMETSGYAEPTFFRRVTGLCDFVYMDLKLADCTQHVRWTGVPNDRILENAAWLRQSGKVHCFRTPLIPGITDSEENLRSIEDIVGDSPWEQLPYNPLAPAKYASVGRCFLYTMASDPKNAKP